MSVRTGRFGIVGSGRGKAAAAVMACAMMLLAGCGGSGGSAAETAKPVLRGALEKITVSFNANGGNGGAMEQQTAAVRTALSANTFFKFGRDFTGWATTKTGDVAYADGADYDFTSSTILYALYGSCSETQPQWVEYRARRTSQHNAEVSFEVKSQFDGVNWTTFTASTESGQSGRVSQIADHGTIQVNDLNAGSQYNFTVTATNAVDCSYTSPPDHTAVWK